MKKHHRFAPSLIIGCLAIALSAPAEEPLAPVIEEIPIPNAKTFDGNVLLGGQPSQENLQQAVDAGYKTIVNLRAPGELTEWDEEEVANAAGLQYISIPISGKAGINLENAKKLAAALDSEGSRPMMLHCGSGNRVGALLALKAFHVDGVDASAALQLGLDNGLTSLKPVVEEALGFNSKP